MSEEKKIDLDSLKQSALARFKQVQPEACVVAEDDRGFHLGYWYTFNEQHVMYTSGISVFVDDGKLRVSPFVGGGEDARDVEPAKLALKQLRPIVDDIAAMIERGDK